MKFLHTSDWQIGMPAAQFGAEIAPQVREARLVSIDRLVAAANEHVAEFMVVAGDVFDDPDVSDAMVQKVARALARFQGTAYLLPGNHDIATTVSLWRRSHLWADAKNVVLMLEPKPMRVRDDLTIFPCPLMKKNSGNDPTRWIAEHGDTNGFRIAVAHGGLRDAGVPEPNFPIARDAAERLRLDYLALGDWHSYAGYADGAGVVRTVYSGAHERTAFGEKDPGKVVLVEIDAPLAPPRLTPISVGELDWRAIEQSDLSGEALSSLNERLRALAPRERHIVKVLLDGTLRADAMPKLVELRSLADAGFLWFDIEDEQVRSAPEDDRWIEGLPLGALRNAARELIALAALDTVAMDALELLYDVAARHGLDVPA